jgi:hypothetical protein
MGRPLTIEDYNLLVRHSPVMIWRAVALFLLWTTTGASRDSSEAV